ncbi:hypothetical protein HYH03_007374 [Edaphochlamys debaryana]|uniref:Peptidase M43 pregnancy-associated plasma-A domain-containing protein n=1 Tax=Edaphochlamys debaryana TaxID=47281 RepID=A0A835Y3M6_9CHLO|nr:hypothetical protein HYH03_007374 [Edaphochlamys debaryana]|eukprot:KAG2494609.1 hypothetical protein HYH03_007374 [Edaphochlamys debaryana]
MTDETARTHYGQLSVIGSGFHVLAEVVSALAGTNSTPHYYNSRILTLFVMTEFNDNQDVLARIYNVAQRLQTSPTFMAQLSDLASSFGSIFQWLRANLSRLTARRMLQEGAAGSPAAAQMMRAFIKAGLQAPELAPVSASLTPTYNDIDALVDLVVDMYASVSALLGRTERLQALDRGAHPPHPPGGDRPPERTTATIPGLDANVSVTLDPYVPSLEVLLAGAAGDWDAAYVPPRASGSRRSLADVQLPGGFVPSDPSQTPMVLLPTVWHILQYKTRDGYGPNGVADACSFQVPRLVKIANTFLLPSRFQIYIAECRNTPGYQYLVKNSKADYARCTSTGDFGGTCAGAILPDAMRDFPRAVNVFVSGEEPDASPPGFGPIPADPNDPFYGYIFLTYANLSPEMYNRLEAFEGGAFTFVHELGHYLGLDHTFDDNGYDPECEDIDQVADTPAARTSPMWQPWGKLASQACVSAWQAGGASYASYAAKGASRVGPQGDQVKAWDTCPGGGPEDYANYMTYSHAACFMTMGHFTSGQIAFMHKVTNEVNPDFYAWGQYWAKNPPAAARGYTSLAPAPPDAAPPAKCASTTANGCSCAASWTNEKGTAFSDCANVQGVGWMCAVDKNDADCVAKRGGWWDYCTRNPDTACASGGSRNAGAATPTPAPAPAGWVPTPCGPGAPTASGLKCSNETWRLKAGSPDFLGCASVDQLPLGPICALPKGTTRADGKGWDYCQDSCKDAKKAAATYPKALCAASAARVTESTCSCKDSWVIDFTSPTKASYTGLSGCTAFQETNGAGTCQVTCTGNRRVNNKYIACTC